MKKFWIIAAVLFIGCESAYAGVFDSVKGWFSGNIIVYIITGILGLGVVGGTIMFSRIVATLQELGEFLTYLGNALADRKFDREELQKTLKEGRDVLDIWKPTPDKYKVD